MRIRSKAFVLLYRVGRCRCHEICILEANLYLSFSVIPGSILGHLGGKICTFEGIKSLRLDVAKQEAKIDRKYERKRQIPISSWSTFRAKMGMGLGAKI